MECWAEEECAQQKEIDLQQIPGYDALYSLVNGGEDDIDSILSTQWEGIVLNSWKLKMKMVIILCI